MTIEERLSRIEHFLGLDHYVPSEVPEGMPMSDWYSRKKELGLCACGRPSQERRPHCCSCGRDDCPGHCPP